MSTIQAARTLLRQTESSLRQLIEVALKEQRYGDVAEMAGLADGLSRLLDSTTAIPGGDARPTPVPVALRSQGEGVATKRPKKTRRSSSKRTEYPRFARDGDRLVKIGWSKKNKSEYEHRVPRSAVDAFMGKLTSAVKSGQVFEVDSLLPVTDQNDEEVPAYQIYVTLAWLRDIGVISKKGRDGYVIDDSEATKRGAEAQWQELSDLSA